MIARGNLKRCIQSALHAYHVQHYPMLAILHNRTGNYYTVVTEEELNKITTSAGDRIHRLMFRGTMREMHCFCTSDQLDLLKGGSVDSHSETP